MVYVSDEHPLARSHGLLRSFYHCHPIHVPVAHQGPALQFNCSHDGVGSGELMVLICEIGSSLSSFPRPAFVLYVLSVISRGNVGRLYMACNCIV
jgi:hypothetical protein